MQESEARTDEIGGGFMACVEDENAVLDKLYFGESSLGVALD